MKQTLLALILLLGGSLFLVSGQADEWPYGSYDFNQAGEAEEEDYESGNGYPPEGESLPGMGEYEEDDDDYYYYDPEEDEDYDASEDDDDSTWLDFDDE